ncbi:hypothetical protein CTI12_AA296390 [Artemisia annua]|uniref:QWRF family n=1 Tax=Artemisia annua TaxID=35608 RepID=A0A2U1N7W6_ARTAN|nr:hypothetical protein CTI12_AA296390 [Artemisia annua]
MGKCPVEICIFYKLFYSFVRATCVAVVKVVQSGTVGARAHRLRASLVKGFEDWFWTQSIKLLFGRKKVGPGIGFNPKYFGMHESRLLFGNLSALIKCGPKLPIDFDINTPGVLISTITLQLLFFQSCRPWHIREKWMEVYESNQVLDTRKPRLFSEKSNGRVQQPVSREVSSRYKSPTPRRCPSPNTTRDVTSSVPVTKRAVSTGRRQPTPQKTSTPPSPSTPVQETCVYTELAARKTSGGNKMPESLWPSRMRSLSVAFQSNTFSMPVSKKEKPPPQPVYDRSLKPSLNVAHKQTVSSPTYRKATPERKRSPLKGKNTIDQLENSKPSDGLHRWPSRTSSNVLNKSIDICDESIKRFSTPNIRRMSLPDDTSKSSSLNKLSGVARGPSPSRTRAMVSAPSRGVSPNHMRPSSPSRQLCNSNPISVLSFTADIKKGKNVANRIEDAHHLRLLYNRQVQWRFVNASSEAVLNYQKVTAEKSLINAQGTMLQLQDSVASKRMQICQLKLQLKLYMALNQQIDYLNQWSTIEREHSFAVHGAIQDLQASTLRLPVTGYATADIQSVKSAVYSAMQVMHTMGSSLQSTLSRVRIYLILNFKLNEISKNLYIFVHESSFCFTPFPKLEESNWLVSELVTVAAQEKTLLDECEALMTSASSLQVIITFIALSLTLNE